MNGKSSAISKNAPFVLPALSFVEGSFVEGLRESFSAACYSGIGSGRFAFPMNPAPKPAS
jgi:hypothetical protein